MGWTGIREAASQGGGCGFANDEFVMTNDEYRMKKTVRTAYPSGLVDRVVWVGVAVMSGRLRGGDGPASGGPGRMRQCMRTADPTRLIAGVGRRRFAGRRGGGGAGSGPSALSVCV